MLFRVWGLGFTEDTGYKRPVGEVLVASSDPQREVLREHSAQTLRSYCLRVCPIYRAGMWSVEILGSALYIGPVCGSCFLSMQLSAVGPIMNPSP